MPRAALLMLVLAASCAKTPAARTPAAVDAASPSPPAAPKPRTGARLPASIAGVSFAEVPDTQLGSAPDAINLLVSRNAVLVEGRPIVALVNGQVDPSELLNGAKGIIVLKLRAELRTHMEHLRKLGHDQPDLLLVADKDTPAHVLGQVVATSGDAGFTHLSVVVHGDAGTGVLDLDIPEPARVSGDGGAPAPDHAVEVTAAGFVVRSLADPAEQVTLADHDLVRLREAVAALPGQTPIVLVPAREAKLQDVATALAASSRRKDGSPLRQVWLGTDL